MDFENVLNNVETDDPELKNKCTLISEGIKSGKCTIVTVIEQLGSLLTNTSVEKRELGVLILTEILKNFPPDFINLQQCEVISTFYIGKLKDHHQIVPVALKGILQIVEFSNFPHQHIPTMLSTLFQNIACQQQQQSDRYNIYAIFKILLEKYITDLLSMGPDLVYGVITSIEGERDPRNLLFLFQWMKTFLKMVPLRHLDEEMFEVLACYFPVDFKSPPHTTQITRDDLAEALCPCLCAIPEFGQYCIPLALEKLDSSLEIAKNDSLKLLEEGCVNFTETTYMEFSYKIWSQLQKETFTCNKSAEIKYLTMLTKLIKKLSHGNEAEFKTFLKNIVDMMKGNLLPDTKHFQISSLILVHIAQGSQFSSNYVVRDISPILTNTFNITTAVIHKAYILRTLTGLAKAFLEYHKNINLSDNKELPNIISLCFQATSEANDDIRSEGLNGFSDLIRYLPLDVRITLYSNIKMLLVKPESDIARRALIKCFQSLASFYGDEVQTHIIKTMNFEDSISLDFYLSALCELVDLEQFREVVIDTLIQCIKENLEWSSISIKNIKLLLSKNRNNADVLEVFVQKKITDILIDFSLNHITVNEDTSILFINISSILELVIGSQDSGNQKQAIDCLDNIYKCIQHNEVYVILLSGLLSRLHRDIDVKYEIIQTLFNIASNSQKKIVFDITVQLLANIINKKSEGELLLNCLEYIKNDCLELLKKEECKAVLILSWISKALILRNHSQSLLWLDLLLGLIEKYSEVAEGFKIILDDSYESMSIDSHCTKMLLYRQKVFTYVTNKLMNEFPVTEPSKMILLGNLLEYAPEQVVLMLFKKISKMVILCLERCQDEKVLLVLLQTVKKLSSIKNDTIEEHLEDFLTRILNLLSFQTSMKVRIEAIRCLVQFISSYPIYKLLPVQAQVLNQLALCTDDRKRLVRKEAMEARSLWFLLGAPI